MTEARDWLPIDVTKRDALRALVSEMVDDWSALWFSKRRLTVASWTPASGGAQGRIEGANWQVYRASIAVNCARRAAAWMLDWALDVRLDEVVLTDADRKLMDAFEKRLIQDLVERIELALGLEGDLLARPLGVRDPFEKLGGVTISLGDSSASPLFLLALPMPAVLPYCRASLPPARPPSASLAPRGQAVVAASLTLQADLGSTEISMSDLRALAPGDTLVLDRRLGAGAQLSHPAGRGVLQAHLTDLDGWKALTLKTSTQ